LDQRRAGPLGRFMRVEERQPCFRLDCARTRFAAGLIRQPLFDQAREPWGVAGHAVALLPFLLFGLEFETVQALLEPGAPLLRERCQDRLAVLPRKRAPPGEERVAGSHFTAHRADSLRRRDALRASQRMTGV